MRWRMILCGVRRYSLLHGVTPCYVMFSLLHVVPPCYVVFSLLHGVPPCYVVFSLVHGILSLYMAFFCSFPCRYLRVLGAPPNTLRVR